MYEEIGIRIANKTWGDIDSKFICKKENQLIMKRQRMKQYTLWKRMIRCTPNFHSRLCTVAYVNILKTEPNLSEILMNIQAFSIKKMHWKMLSAKKQPFSLGLNVLTYLP